MDPAGDFIVAMQLNAEGYGVFAQRYSLTSLVGINPIPLAYTANAGVQAIDPTMTLVDGESTTITSATVAITSGYVSGEDVLAFSNQNGISGSFNSTAGALVLMGSASVATYQAALETVTYSDRNNNASTAGPNGDHYGERWHPQWAAPAAGRRPATGPKPFAPGLCEWLSVLYR